LYGAAGQLQLAAGELPLVAGELPLVAGAIAFAVAAARGKMTISKSVPFADFFVLQRTAAIFPESRTNWKRERHGEQEIGKLSGGIEGSEIMQRAGDNDDVEAIKMEK
jgi:hypothetical protein